MHTTRSWSASQLQKESSTSLSITIKNNKKFSGMLVIMIEYLSSALFKTKIVLVFFNRISKVS